MDRQKMADRIATDRGFIAALDQSGGSTPNTLQAYGIPAGAYSGESDMYRLIHEMRARIIRSPAFNRASILGAILFERTMDSAIDGIPTAEYLWKTCNIVPFLKVDKGMLDEADGVQLMKPMPDLDGLLDRAIEKGIFGTKMRSVIHATSGTGIAAIVTQQFDVARQILSKGLVPIIEPEVTITMADKAAAESLLRDEIVRHLDQLPPSQHVMLKLTLPEEANLYRPLASHQNVTRMVALSGGYDRETANTRLARNAGMIASFSRALTEGLSASQSDIEFDAQLGKTVSEIYAASCAG